MNRNLVVAAAATWALIPSGCSQAEFGESVNLPAGKHASLVDDFAAGKPLVLPANTGFNLWDSQRQAAAAGRAESAADPAGTARCQATVSGTGTAQAEFQLGHVLDNRSGEPLAVTVRFEVDYECSLTGTTGSDPAKPEDELGLRVFVRDSNRRVLKSMTLTDAHSRLGPDTWKGQQSPAFDVTLEPDLAYYFVLAGRVAVTGTEGGEWAAAVGVRSLKLELTPHPESSTPDVPVKGSSSE